jgi:hypothetical protein
MRIAYESKTLKTVEGAMPISTGIHDLTRTKTTMEDKAQAEKALVERGTRAIGWLPCFCVDNRATPSWMHNDPGCWRICRCWLRLCCICITMKKRCKTATENVLCFSWLWKTFQSRAHLMFWLNVFACLVHLGMIAFLLGRICLKGNLSQEPDEALRVAEYHNLIQSLAASNGVSTSEYSGAQCLATGTCRDSLPLYRARLQFCGLWYPSDWAQDKISSCAALSSTSHGLQPFERVCIHRLDRLIKLCGLTHLYAGSVVPFTNTTFRNAFGFRWDLVPEFDTQLPVVDLGVEWTSAIPPPETVPLKTLAVTFFALSAGFHLIIVLGSLQNGFYFTWMDQCRQPLRWIEYSISASVMLYVIAFFSGIRDQLLLFAITILCFCTITYGWVTEALSRPDPRSRKRPTVGAASVYERFNSAPQDLKIFVNQYSTMETTSNGDSVAYTKMRDTLLALLQYLETTYACEVARQQTWWSTPPSGGSKENARIYFGAVPDAEQSLTSRYETIEQLKGILFYEPYLITGTPPIEAMMSPPTRWEIDAIRSPHLIVAGGLVRFLLWCHYEAKAGWFWLPNKLMQSVSSSANRKLVPLSAVASGDQTPLLTHNSLALRLAHLIATIQRLGPNILGWVPYGTAWGIVLHTYHYSIDVLTNGTGPPEWVTFVIYGQIGVFTVFAVVQIAQQWNDYGCEHYWHGEVVYVILSFIAKAMLGLVLSFNLLVFCEGLGRLADQEEG